MDREAQCAAVHGSQRVGHLNNYNIDITRQMLGQHLKQLVQSGLIDEVVVKKEVPNKIGRDQIRYEPGPVGDGPHTRWPCRRQREKHACHA